MYQGSPKDVGLHLSRMGRKLPKGENPIEFLIDVIQQYDQSEYGVDALAEFVLTGMKPPQLLDIEISFSTILPSPTPPPRRGKPSHDKGGQGKRLHLQTVGRSEDEKSFDHSLRSPWNNGNKSWSQSGILESIKFTPTRKRNDQKTPYHPR